MVWSLEFNVWLAVSGGFVARMSPFIMLNCSGPDRPLSSLLTCAGLWPSHAENISINTRMKNVQPAAKNICIRQLLHNPSDGAGWCRVSLFIGDGPRWQWEPFWVTDSSLWRADLLSPDNWHNSLTRSYFLLLDNLHQTPLHIPQHWNTGTQNRITGTRFRLSVKIVFNKLISIIKLWCEMIWIICWNTVQIF